MRKLNMKKVMKEAVKLAKKMEGDWIARMKMALKTIWAMVKKETETMKNKLPLNKTSCLSTKARNIEWAFTNEVIHVTANVWEKYNLRRIYVNSQGLKVGYLQFDENGNFEKGFGEYSDWDMGKTTSVFNTIKEAFANGRW